MISFMFLSNYSGFWLENGLPETGVVAVGMVRSEVWPSSRQEAKVA